MSDDRWVGDGDAIAEAEARKRRERAIGTAVGAGAAALVVAVVVIVLIVVNRGDDDPDVLGSVPSTTPAETTVPDSAPPAGDPTTVPPTDPPATTVPATTEPATTLPATTVPATTVPTTSTTAPPPAAAGWTAATEQFPDLAFIACCGANWVGEPSPPVPADAAAPLAPGIYNLRAEFVEAPAVFSDGLITLEVRPYMRCADLAGIGFCEGEEPFPADELGVPSDPTRVFDLSLDDSVRVAVSGFACSPGELSLDQQVGTGTDLAKMAAALDAAYEASIGVRLREGVRAAQIVADLTAAPANGFTNPGCPDWTELMWTPSSGPGVKADGIHRVDTESNELPLESASASWVRPTALVVDDDGSFTLYFYAGFLS